VFIELEETNQAKEAFRDKTNARIIRIQKFVIGPFNLTKNVYMSDGLKLNWLRISQFCDKGSKVTSWMSLAFKLEKLP